MGGKSSKDKNSKIIRKKIVVIGLENVGKTTLVQKLKYGQAQNVKPTIGFNLESFKSNGLDLMVFDVAGGARSMWPHYLENADIIIFVVDST
jgi:small GTP-binding protein